MIALRPTCRSCAHANMRNEGRTEVLQTFNHVYIRHWLKRVLMLLVASHSAHVVGHASSPSGLLVPYMMYSILKLRKLQTSKFSLSVYLSSINLVTSLKGSLSSSQTQTHLK